MSVHPLETFLADCHAVRTTGANAPETSFYPALSTLFNEVGRHLNPKVRCVMGLKDQGAGMQDGGLFTESQFATRRDQIPLPGQMPERGVIEVKPVGADLGKLAATEQVVRYWTRYRLVLLTDLREFVLLGEEGGATVVRERYALPIRRRISERLRDIRTKRQSRRANASKNSCDASSYMLRLGCSAWRG